MLLFVILLVVLVATAAALGREWLVSAAVWHVPFQRGIRRVPDAQIGFDALGWLTRGHLLCVPMLIGGVALLLHAHQRDDPANYNRR